MKPKKETRRASRIESTMQNEVVTDERKKMQALKAQRM